MNTLLKTYTGIAFALAAFVTSCAHAQNTIIESALNDAYTLFEELITEGSKKTGLADRGFHTKFSTAKKSYLARYKKEIAPLLSDELFMPKFKLEVMALNVDAFTSAEKKARHQNVILRIEKTADDEIRKKIFGLTMSFLYFFAPYVPHGDIFLHGMPEDKQALNKGMWLFAFFQLLDTIYQKDQELGTDIFSIVCDDPYSPLYPMVHGFTQKTTPKTCGRVLKKLTKTLDYGLCSMFHKVLKNGTDPQDWFYTFLKTDAEQWGALNLAKEIEAQCCICCK